MPSLLHRFPIRPPHISITPQVAILFSLIYPTTSLPLAHSADGPLPGPQPPIPPSPDVATVPNMWSLSEHQAVHSGDGCGHLTTGEPVYSGWLYKTAATSTWPMNAFSTSPLPADLQWWQQCASEFVMQLRRGGGITVVLN